MRKYIIQDLVSGRFYSFDQRTNAEGWQLNAKDAFVFDSRNFAENTILNMVYKGRILTIIKIYYND